MVTRLRVEQLRYHSAERAEAEAAIADRMVLLDERRAIGRHAQRKRAEIARVQKARQELDRLLSTRMK